MSLLRRQSRPLKRDSETLGDTRLFIIACDDTYAPKQYFGFFRLARIQIHVIETQDGRSSAEHVLERLATFDHEPDDELWMLLDTDHYAQGTHLQSFRAALQKAKQRGVRVALSRPCFELWLLLHHLEETAVGSLSKAADVEEGLAHEPRRIQQDITQSRPLPARVGLLGVWQGGRSRQEGRRRRYSKCQYHPRVSVVEVDRDQVSSMAIAPGT
jgi:RloB-like protein